MSTLINEATTADLFSFSKVDSSLRIVFMSAASLIVNAIVYSFVATRSVLLDLRYVRLQCLSHMPFDGPVVRELFMRS